MPITKKRDHQTETRLLLESNDPIDLPAAEVADDAILVQFEKFKPFIPELLEALRTGSTAEPVAVMNDGSTFAIHGATRTFWVKLWHTAGTELTRIERAQIISCLPSTRGTNVIIGDAWTMNNENSRRSGISLYIWQEAAKRSKVHAYVGPHPNPV